MILTARYLSLVLAVLSHAGGTHEQTESLPERLDDGTEVVTPWGPRIDLAQLYPWPADQDHAPERWVITGD